MGYEMITLRELVGTILVEEGKKNPDIFVLDSDLAKSTTTNKFQAEFPDRFLEFGIAEQNAMSIAAGIATEGKDSCLCQLYNIYFWHLLDTASPALLRKSKCKADCHPSRHGWLL